MAKKPERFEMRVSSQFLMMIDDWRRLQDPIPSKTEAVTALCEKAMRADFSAAIECEDKRHSRNREDRHQNAS